MDVSALRDAHSSVAVYIIYYLERREEAVLKLLKIPALS